jgi:hypothetical protein
MLNVIALVPHALLAAMGLLTIALVVSTCDCRADAVVYFGGRLL